MSPSGNATGTSSHTFLSLVHTHHSSHLPLERCQRSWFPDGTLIPPPERKLWLPPPPPPHTHSGALPGEGMEGAFPGRCWPGFMGGIHGLSCREGRTVPLAAFRKEPAHRAQRPHWPQGLPDTCYPLRWAMSSRSRDRNLQQRVPDNVAM